MKKTKLLAIILSALVMVAFTGCSLGEKDSPNTSENSGYSEGHSSSENSGYSEGPNNSTDESMQSSGTSIGSAYPNQATSH